MVNQYTVVVFPSYHQAVNALNISISYSWKQLTTKSITKLMFPAHLSVSLLKQPGFRTQFSLAYRHSGGLVVKYIKGSFYSVDPGCFILIGRLIRTLGKILNATGINRRHISDDSAGR